MLHWSFYGLCYWLFKYLKMGVTMNCGIRFHRLYIFIICYVLIQQDFLAKLSKVGDETLHVLNATNLIFQISATNLIQLFNIENCSDCNPLEWPSLGVYSANNKLVTRIIPRQFWWSIRKILVVIISSTQLSWCTFCLDLFAPIKNDVRYWKWCKKWIHFTHL